MTKLEEVEIIFSHKNCYDGTASAIICSAAYAKINKDPYIKFIQYGSEEHDNLKPEYDSLFVDITPSLKNWEKWKDFNPIVLDHHETAKNAVEGRSGTCGDENSSGALLAYENVFIPLAGEDEKWRDFAYLCMVRDTWKTKHERWKEAQEISHALYYHSPWSMITQARIGSFNIEELRRFGKLIYKKVLHKAETIAKYSFKESVVMESGEELIILYSNVSEKIIDETAEYMKENELGDVFIGYFLNSEGNMVVSIRSSKISCNSIAEKFGGGGHKGAAGFRISNGNDVTFNDLKNMVSRSLQSS
jgi:oligoribonuclease NrnB/cAMP/cGMP phosphodiesterase (DHH superfamily)